MRMEIYLQRCALSVGLVFWGVAAMAAAVTPSAEQALKLAPIQKDVDYSQPQGDDIAKCKIAAQKIDGYVGWVVEDARGVVLRRFLDTNGDNKVDQWSYYKDGLEVYRDIDSNFNGKADQYRWFHTGGSRWGIDRDEDNKIDSWKYISAEEATAEVVAAMAEADVERFMRVTLSPADLKSLALGPTRSKELAAKIDGLEARFKEMLAKQKAVTPETKWVQFSGTRPGVVPARTQGSAQDIQVYENAVAIVQTGGAHGQMQIGTLVLGPYGWRVIDLPHPLGEGQAELAGGFFFHAAPPERSKGLPSAAATEEVQKLMAAIEELDQAARSASPEERPKYNARKADLLERMADQSKPEERAMWLRQLADTISVAVQSGGYPEGGQRLQELFERLQKNGESKPLAAYVRFRQLTVEYGLAMQAKNADFVAIQGQWRKKLEAFIGDYPDTSVTAEAMSQLAMALEFAGQEEDATKWYGRVVKSFPDAPAAIKASGAMRRLESVGNSLSLQGKGANGETIDTAKYRGKVVLVHYWATWCNTCSADVAVLKEMLSKHGSAGLVVVGVNLDNTAREMADYVSQNGMTWPQIFEEGGLDSRPANEMGILTLPTMILIDTQGKVAHRNVHTTELDREIKRLLR